MSANDDRLSADATPAIPSQPQSLGNHSTSGPESAPDGQQGRQFASDEELIAELKKHVEETRLPPDLREEVLASLPSLEGQDRMYREMQEKGGLSSEEFLTSLGLDDEPQQ